MREDFEEQRNAMVDVQLKARGLSDERLLAAFRTVPRHLFVPESFRHDAYADHPLPIGQGQTISQPLITALMISHLNLQGHERVLEIGSGSGYQTALLAQLALEVWSIERHPQLLRTSAQRLHELGYRNVHFLAGDGTHGWPEHAPYDAVIVSAAAPRIPGPLLEQLGENGRMILPLGTHRAQQLTLVHKTHNSVERREFGACMFVPLIGEHGWPESLNP